eukprot:1177054-Prorocentrum_minimum.AAC.2
MKGLPFNTAEVLAWDPSLSSLAGLRDAIPFLKPEPKYNSKHVQLMGPATRAFDLEAFRKDVTKPVFQPTRDPQHLLATAVQLSLAHNASLPTCTNVVTYPSHESSFSSSSLDAIHLHVHRQEPCMGASRPL